MRHEKETSRPQPPAETMRKQRKLETAEERRERLKLEARQKERQEADDEAAVDRMIRQNIELYGP